MAKDHDREHFEDYRKQTEVKHEILAAYLPAYFHILKTYNKNLVFIDGFAGRGTYTKKDTGETFPGSPLRALQLIADTPAFAQKVSTVFIESDDVLLPELQAEVDAFYAAHKNIRKPDCFHATFEDSVKKVLEEVQGKLAPTFLFVDPCGVDGAKFRTIKSVMDVGKCEAFIFFNIDGVRRIAGLNNVSPILVDLMGSERRARAVFDVMRATHDPEEKEIQILNHYKIALKEDMGVDRITSFRIEHEVKHITSHYLIHATKSPLGFRIMKDVMWKRGRDEDQPGSLSYVQSSRANYIPMFDVRGDDVKREILGALKSGPLVVSTFYKTWTERPEDMLCESAYREQLLKLEASGDIEVLTKDGKDVVTANSRVKRKGKATLAEDYYVRLKK